MFRIWWTVALGISVVGFGCGGGGKKKKDLPNEPFSEPADPETYVTSGGQTFPYDRALVLLSGDPNIDDAQEFAEDNDARLVGFYPSIGAIQLEVDASTAEELFVQIDALAEQDGVLSAGNDPLLEYSIADDYESEQREAFDQARIPDALQALEDSGFTAASQDAPVQIAVFDTGIVENHPEFIGVLDVQNSKNHRWNAIIPGNSFPADWDFERDGKTVKTHGTGVTGIIGAITNDSGMTGVLGFHGATNETLLDYQIQVHGVSGMSQALVSFEHATDTDVRIINISAVIPGSTLEDIEDEIELLRSVADKHSDVLFVFAAGNVRKADTTDDLAAQFDVASRVNRPNVVTVNGLDSNGTTEGGASKGTTDQSVAEVTVSAPFNVWTIAGNEYLARKGTSFSAPIVSGVAALLLAADSDLSAADLKARLRSSGSEIPYDPSLSDGRQLDAYAALCGNPAEDVEGLIDCGISEIDECDGSESFKFVLDSLNLPSNATEAQQLTLDLDGDGAPDNVFGGLLGALSGSAGLVFAAATDAQVQRGDFMQLLGMQASALTQANDARLCSYEGTSPSVAPCADPETLETCGQHLQGGVTFAIANDSPTVTGAPGMIAASEFASPAAASELTSTNFIVMSVSDGNPVLLPLVAAKAKATTSLSSLTEGIIAGGLSSETVDNIVLPALTYALNEPVQADCTQSGPDCGCTPASSGATILALFDDNGDCQLPLLEVRQAPLVETTLLNPDLDLLNGQGNPGTDGAGDHLSLGLGFTAASASY